jgi:hypothetical protein
MPNKKTIPRFGIVLCRFLSVGHLGLCGGWCHTSNASSRSDPPSSDLNATKTLTKGEKGGVQVFAHHDRISAIAILLRGLRNLKPNKCTTPQPGPP